MFLQAPNKVTIISMDERCGYYFDENLKSFSKDCYINPETLMILFNQLGIVWDLWEVKQEHMYDDYWGMNGYPPTLQEFPFDMCNDITAQAHGHFGLD